MSKTIASMGFVAFIGMFSVAVLILLFKLWLVGSLITSSVKAVSQDCKSTYGIESVVSGNWFCSSKGVK